MKTLEEIKTYKSGPNCEFLQARDRSRLLAFLPLNEWPLLGFTPKDGATHEPEEFTRENVLRHLQEDLAFAFEKALNHRGISSSLMYDVIKMWMWVLDDELANHDSYAMYGLPLYKAVAVKYGFPNPIGEDTGSEPEYDEQYDEPHVDPEPDEHPEEDEHPEPDEHPDPDDTDPAS